MKVISKLITTAILLFLSITMGKKIAARIDASKKKKMARVV